MKFSIIGDTILLGGTAIASLAPGLGATLREQAVQRLTRADAALTDMEGARMEASGAGAKK